MEYSRTFKFSISGYDSLFLKSNRCHLWKLGKILLHKVAISRVDLDLQDYHDL